MTELEIMERARLYMEKLANGINPLTDEPVGEDDVINNVRLSRCFFYVTDVLRQVIENGGVESAGPVAKKKKLPFSLTAEQRAEFVSSQTPLSVTELAKRISRLCENENMKGLKYDNIRCWLLECGLLYETEVNGRYTLRPTQNGECRGIMVEQRVSPSKGPYEVVLYDAQIQQLIMDNLDAVIAINNRPRTETACEQAGN